jgi:hypothetical protein
MAPDAGDDGIELERVRLRRVAVLVVGLVEHLPQRDVEVVARVVPPPELVDKATLRVPGQRWRKKKTVERLRLLPGWARRRFRVVGVASRQAAVVVTPTVITPPKAAHPITKKSRNRFGMHAAAAAAQNKNKNESGARQPERLFLFRT